MKGNKILKILLVEDNLFEVLRFEKTINSIAINCEVTHAKHGGEAITSLQQQVLPDLIILDLDMPELSGLQFLEIIKQYEHLQDIPTIIHSSHIGQQEIAQCFKLGVAGFMVKTTDHENYVLNLQKTLLKWHKKVA
ncbi:MAG: response regulator [Flavobacteriaceae bacterium]|nr:MAG: response regulator [Flavobacteriaceae bacterium]